MVINSKQIKVVGQEEVITNDVKLSAALVDTYTAILTSNRVMDSVNKELGINLPAATIRSYVAVEPVEGTQVLKVTVDNTDPKLAAKICNAIMQVAPPAIAETIAVGSINVLDSAKVPEFPEQPATLRNAVLGAMVGFILGFVIVIILVFSDKTIKNGRDVKNRLGLDLLGSIPFISSKAIMGQGNPLVTSDTVGFGFIEAYKATGTNIRFSSAAAKAKKLLVTGALSGEGKSTVAVNLAITIAKTGKSVLLVDCDLRKSNIYKLLELEVKGNKELSSALLGDVAAEDCFVYIEKTGIYVIPNMSSVPNPSELLGSEKMADLLASLEKHFDYIILDTPPSYLLTDAVVLSAYTDGVIFVVKQGYTKEDIIKLSLAGFEHAGIPIIGCILNGMKYYKVGAISEYRYDKQYLGKYY